jgi:hypothetical protein
MICGSNFYDGKFHDEEKVGASPYCKIFILSFIGSTGFFGKQTISFIFQTKLVNLVHD